MKLEPFESYLERADELAQFTGDTFFFTLPGDNQFLWLLNKANPLPNDSATQLPTPRFE